MAGIVASPSAAGLLPAWLCVAVGLLWLSAAWRLADSASWGWRSCFLLGTALIFMGRALDVRPPASPALPLATREISVTVELQRRLGGYDGQTGFLGKVIPSASPTSPDAHLVYVLAWAGKQEPALLPGARVPVRGRWTWLNHPEANSTFDAYLRQIGAAARIQDAELLEAPEPASWPAQTAALLREDIRRTLLRGANSEAAQAHALRQLAMLTGQKDYLSRADRETYSVAGVMHLFAVSGLHIGILGAFLHGLLRLARAGPGLRCTLAILLTGLWVWLINAPPSAVRAWLMFSVALLSVSARQPRCLLSAWFASALLVLALDPRQLFSLGFQLSYAVTGGLILFVQPLTLALWKQARLWNSWTGPAPGWRPKLLRWALAALATSMTAVLFGTPLVIAAFERFSFIAVFANALLVPAAMVAVPVSATSAVLGLLPLGGLAEWLNYFGRFWFSLMDAVAKLAATIPGAAVTTSWRWPWLGQATSGLLLLMATRVPVEPDRHHRLWWPLFALLACLPWGLKLAGTAWE